MTDKLSPHFKLAEFIKSDTAKRMGNENLPTPEHLANLTFTAENMELVRSLLGFPILISSGYRNPEVNRAVGGVPNSQHALGLAVDFSCPRFGSNFEVAKKISESNIQFDQLIYEVTNTGTWIHISFSKDRKPRRSVLTQDKRKPSGQQYLTGIKNI